MIIKIEADNSQKQQDSGCEQLGAVVLYTRVPGFESIFINHWVTVNVTEENVITKKRPKWPSSDPKVVKIVNLFKSTRSCGCSVKVHSPQLRTVWPDLAEFRHLGKILLVFGNLLTVYEVFDKILTILWQTIYVFGQTIIVKNWTKNLAIWSHWLRIFLCYAESLNDVRKDGERWKVFSVRRTLDDIFSFELAELQNNPNGFICLITERHLRVVV